MNSENSIKTVETGEINLFTTCPPYTGTDRGEYIERVRRIARWSDEAGCKGILVYTDNSVVDPWLLSQIIIQNTVRLEPLVAVQSVYMHPFSLAKMVSSLGFLHNRRLCLNMVAGGFKNDLIALDDSTPHDRRYDRLVEYTTIVQRLLASGAVSFEGEFYRVNQLTLKPALPAELLPFITISGSSEAGLAAAHALGAVPIKYPEPPERCVTLKEDRDRGCGIRVGIIARENEEEAWRVADQRFPPDRGGQLMHKLAMKVSDSVWHQTLSGLNGTATEARGVYWLWPFQNYKTFCPYLVGSHRQVAEELGRYLSAGYSTFILDVPASEEDMTHIATAFAHSGADFQPAEPLSSSSTSTRGNAAINAAS